MKKSSVPFKELIKPLPVSRYRALAPYVSEWASSQKMATLKNALESGRDTIAFELLSDKEIALTPHLLSRAFGCAMGSGARLSAAKLLAMGADARSAFPEHGRLDAKDEPDTVYETPMGIALMKGRFELAKWLYDTRGKEAMPAGDRRSRGAFLLTAFGSGYAPSSRRAALEWALKAAPAPSPRDAALIALAGEFETLDLLLDRVEPALATRMARACQAPLCSWGAEPGAQGVAARASLERALALSDGKTEPGLGFWDPRDCVNRFGSMASRARDAAEDLARRGEARDEASRMGWPRLCALMSDSLAAFAMLESIPVVKREAHEIGLWEARAQAALDGREAWMASEPLGSLWSARQEPRPLSESEKPPIQERVRRVGSWLERACVERVLEDGGKVGKQRAKKSARAARREAARALEAGDEARARELLEPLEQEAPAARRPRL